VLERYVPKIHMQRCGRKLWAASVMQKLKKENRFSVGKQIDSSAFTLLAQNRVFNLLQGRFPDFDAYHWFPVSQVPCQQTSQTGTSPNSPLRHRDGAAWRLLLSEDYLVLRPLSPEDSELRLEFVSSKCLCHLQDWQVRNDDVLELNICHPPGRTSVKEQAVTVALCVPSQEANAIALLLSRYAVYRK